MTRTVLGLIADTHVPDRCRRLHPQVLPIFARAGVNAILHAGDISTPDVLEQLESVAPVVAVRGNRDWFGFDDLPLKRQITVGQVTIGLTHGHGGLRPYWSDKWRYIIFGPQPFEKFTLRAMQMFPQADVIVHGHSHEPLIKHIQGKLVINPGSPCHQTLPDKLPSVGLLTIQGKNLTPELIELI